MAVLCGVLYDYKMTNELMDHANSCGVFLLLQCTNVHMYMYLFYSTYFDSFSKQIYSISDVNMVLMESV